MARNDRFFKHLKEVRACVALFEGTLQKKLIHNLGKAAVELSRETLERQQQPTGRPWEPLKGQGAALKRGEYGPIGKPPLANVAGFLAYLEAGLVFTLEIPEGWAHFHQNGYAVRTSGSSAPTAERIAKYLSPGGGMIKADASERKRRGRNAYRVPVRRIFPGEKQQIPPRWSRAFELVVFETVRDVTGKVWNEKF